MLSAVLATLLVWGAAGSPRLPLVVIDPGHGGELDGAVGVCGAKEDDVVLGVSLELAKILEASGRARVRLTRHDDANIELHARAEQANDAGAHLFVSVHANSGAKPQSRGVETFFLSSGASDRRTRALALRENEGRSLPQATSATDLDRILTGLTLNASHHESQRFAMRLQEQLHAQLETRGRGVLQAPFIVLNAARMPAALVEIGFLTNPEECALLATPEHQVKVARALATAIIAHVTSERLVTAAASTPAAH